MISLISMGTLLPPAHFLVLSENDLHVLLCREVHPRRQFSGEESRADGIRSCREPIHEQEEAEAIGLPGA